MTAVSSAALAETVDLALSAAKRVHRCADEARNVGAWHNATNKHPTTDGRPWGAIEVKRHPAGGAGTALATWKGGLEQKDAEYAVAAANAFPLFAAALDRLVALLDSERQARENAERERDEAQARVRLYITEVEIVTCRAEAAEKERDRLAEALREIADPGCDHCVPPDSCLAGGYEDRCPACIARAALAVVVAERDARLTEDESRTLTFKYDAAVADRDLLAGHLRRLLDVDNWINDFGTAEFQDAAAALAAAGSGGTGWAKRELRKSGQAEEALRKAGLLPAGSGGNTEESGA